MYIKICTKQKSWKSVLNNKKVFILCVCVEMNEARVRLFTPARASESFSYFFDFLSALKLIIAVSWWWEREYKALYN